MGISWLAIAGARRVTAVVDQRSSFNLLTFAGCLSFRYVTLPLTLRYRAHAITTRDYVVCQSTSPTRCVVYTSAVEFVGTNSYAAVLCTVKNAAKLGSTMVQPLIVSK